MAEATNPITTASNLRVGEDWVLVPRVLSERMRKTLHSSVSIRCYLDKREASILNDQAWWEAVLAAASAPVANSPAELSRLAELSEAATPGAWYTVDTPWGDGTWLVAGNPDPHAGIMVCDCQDVNETRPEDGPDAADDAAFIAASVNYVRKLIRSGKLVASTGSGKEETKGASFGPGSCPSGPTASRSSGFAAAIPSRTLREAAKLAEIPPAGSEERDFWLEAAEQHGFSPPRDDDSEDNPPWLAWPSAILKLMSEARKQGQRDVLAASSTGDGWQPLKTAPQDGEVILVASLAGTGPTLCSFADGYFRLVSTREKLAGYGIWFWMPLPAPPEALAGEAEGRDRQGSVHEHAAPQGATPEATPQSSPSQTLVDPKMTVEEAREVLDGLSDMLPPDGHIKALRSAASRIASSAPRRSRSLDARASRIELALRTLQAAGEAR